ncbi:outer membrane beta-barrel protein [Helicobacter labacensis]|uniref:outer membrane beta-barrel protein n=1 Tax=Helicobacter labacensis TaxID=2316079 RepID=UPI001F4635B5|nr:outer membrane beta-barrel protein [Helicobacter labacensis]
MLLFRLRRFVGLLVCLAGALGAEKNGVFVGGGFVYSHFTRVWDFKMVMENIYEPFAPVPKVGATITGGNSHTGALYGGNLQVGYKQFFGKPKLFGLRYFAFASAQGGNYSYLTFNAKAQSINATQSAAVFFYGAGMDLLANFYDKNDQSFGMFVGGILGGESWLLGKSYASNKTCQTQLPLQARQCVSADAVWENQATMMESRGNQAKYYKIPSFQVAIQAGLRVHLTKHQGFEVGVRYPFIPHPYYEEVDKNKWGNYGRGGSAHITLQRKLVLFANYIYNF